MADPQPQHPHRELSILAGAPPVRPDHLVTVADSTAALDAYRRLRHEEFVVRQGLFTGTDRDDIDDDPRAIVLVAAAGDGTILGGVRIAPVCAPDIGWWTGSRLVVADTAHARGVGAALIRAACARVESEGVLRFEATVQQRHAALFRRLGWRDAGAAPAIGGSPHLLMRWSIDAVQRTVEATKAMLADVLAPLGAQAGGLGPAGFRGDDGVPVPHSDVIAACDAIVPSMVERDPEWAGWCAVLVNINDLSAMGARPLGLLDAVGAPTRSHLTRIVRGLAAAAAAWRTPVLGGHTQVGVPAALSVTALGAAGPAMPAGAGRVGDVVSLTADLGGGWRPGYRGRQWDSTSRRSSEELVAMAGLTARMRPRAAKDVSMAGIAGTLGMLAEASGTGAELDVAAIPRPRDAAPGSWLTCFPGFAMLTADDATTDPTARIPAGPTSTAACGRLSAQPGVRLVWPDGVSTVAVASTVTGLGAA
ncbi:MSMEG_0567/sll0787 family protein [Millisia brevis]|uniref:MSMEG_0567/sll0787 family protein n=1 Tax=Millisia brevis TaxID=264148 RepID=UPI000835E713|nr:MSMEG_0567/sll0787 family protein [Millisia brevis]